MSYRGGRSYSGGYNDRFATEDPLAAAIQGVLSGGIGMFDTVRGYRQENADRAADAAAREAALERQSALDARDQERWQYGVSRDAQARQDALDAEKRQREQKLGDRLTARGISAVPLPNAGGGFSTTYAKVGPSEQEEEASLEYAVKQKFATDELRGQAKALGIQGAEGMSYGELQQVVSDAAKGRERDAEFGDFKRRQRVLEAGRTGPTRGMPGQGAGGAPPADNKDEMPLRKEFNGEMARHTQIAPALAKIRESAKMGTGQGDMGIIYGFMRMQDPGSTVREGEYATAQNSAGIPEQVRQFYNKALDGQKLAPEVRQKFVSAAETLAAAEREQARQAITRYAGLAVRYGIPADAIVYDPYDAVLGPYQTGGNRTRRPMSAIVGGR